MRLLSLLLGVMLMTATTTAASAQDGAEGERPAWRLVIHGGAGVIERARLTRAIQFSIQSRQSTSWITRAASLSASNPRGTNQGYAPLRLPLAVIPRHPEHQHVLLMAKPSAPEDAVITSQLQAVYADITEYIFTS